MDSLQDYVSRMIAHAPRKDLAAKNLRSVAHYADIEVNLVSLERVEQTQHMVEITPAAQEHFRKLLETQPEGTQIRVFVIEPGAPQAECGVAYCPPKTVGKSEQVVSFDGFLLYIDSESLPFLREAKIDFVVEDAGAHLTIKAPHAKGHMPAADAPLFERVEYFLQSETNPKLAAHRGHVALLDITQEGLAVLQFGGGCDGCAMVGMTLKEGIEKELLAHFPELKGVEDATEHRRGEHSYC